MALSVRQRVRRRAVAGPRRPGRRPVFHGVGLRHRDDPRDKPKRCRFRAETFCSPVPGDAALLGAYLRCAECLALPDLAGAADRSAAGLDLHFGAHLERVAGSTGRRRRRRLLDAFRRGQVLPACGAALLFDPLGALAAQRRARGEPADRDRAPAVPRPRSRRARGFQGLDALQLSAALLGRHRVFAR